MERFHFYEKQSFRFNNGEEKTKSETVDLKRLFLNKNVF